LKCANTRPTTPCAGRGKQTQFLGELVGEG